MSERLREIPSDSQTTSEVFSRLKPTPSTDPTFTTAPRFEESLEDYKDRLIHMLAQPTNEDSILPSPDLKIRVLQRVAAYERRPTIRIKRWFQKIRRIL